MGAYQNASSMTQLPKRKTQTSTCTWFLTVSIFRTNLLDLYKGDNTHIPHRSVKSNASLLVSTFIKLSKGAKIRNRYYQVPHLTQDTKGKVTNSQKDTTNESQRVSPFPAGGHKAHINRRIQRHNKHKTEKT